MVRSGIRQVGWGGAFPGNAFFVQNMGGTGGKQLCFKVVELEQEWIGKMFAAGGADGGMVGGQGHYGQSCWGGGKKQHWSLPWGSEEMRRGWGQLCILEQRSCGE